MVLVVGEEVEVVQGKEAMRERERELALERED